MSFAQPHIPLSLALALLVAKVAIVVVVAVGAGSYCSALGFPGWCFGHRARARR